MIQESDICYEGPAFYVLKTRKRFEVIKKAAGLNPPYLVGHGTDEADAIRTAKALERYPNNA